MQRRDRVCAGAQEAEQLHPRLIGQSGEIARDRARARRLRQAPRGSGPLRLRPPQALRRRLEAPAPRIPDSLPKCGYPRRARSDRAPPQPNLDAAGRLGAPNPGPGRDLWDPQADCDIRQGHANGPPGRGEPQVSGDCEAACGRRQRQVAQDGACVHARRARQAEAPDRAAGVRQPRRRDLQGLRGGRARAVREAQVPPRRVGGEDGGPFGEPSVVFAGLEPGQPRRGKRERWLLPADAFG